MKFAAAIALIALALPVFAQRGGGHAASGSRGFSGHAGFSGASGFSRGGSVGFSRPGGFARFSTPIRFGAPGNMGLRGLGTPPYAGRPFAGYPNRFMGARPAYRATGPGRSYEGNRAGDWDRGHRGGDRNGDRDHDRFDARRRSFDNWYNNFYPTWLSAGYGYPYVIDPGFYDWSLPDDSDDESGVNPAYDEGGVEPDYPAPYPEYGYGAPRQMPQDGFAGEVPAEAAQSNSRAAAEPAAPSAPNSSQKLTVIFKNDRAPVKMQNYMMTAKVLTDLDAQHYEQIPIDQIDVAATERVNQADGVGFAIPGASRN